MRNACIQVSLILLILLFHYSTLIAQDRQAFPESRDHSPGYFWKTVTAIRKGPDEYSSKIIGTPVTIPADTTLHSVWFVMDFVLYDPEASAENTIRQGIFRGGITSFDHFKTNPLESPLDTTPNHLPGNFAFNSGVGLDDTAFTELERQSISVTPIESLPGTFLVGLGFEKPWTASEETEVWAWVNVEYPTGDQLVRVYSFQDTAGLDFQVNQMEELTPLKHTMMIWLEQGAPFENQVLFELSLNGSKKKKPSLATHFIANRIFKKNPFNLGLEIEGTPPVNSELFLYMSINGHRCNTPMATLKSYTGGFINFTGIGPKAPRRRLPIKFTLTDSNSELKEITGKLINKRYRGRKKGKLRYQKVQSICQKTEFN